MNVFKSAGVAAFYLLVAFELGAVLEDYESIIYFVCGSAYVDTLRNFEI